MIFQFCVSVYNLPLAALARSAAYAGRAGGAGQLVLNPHQATSIYVVIGGVITSVIYNSTTTNNTS